MNKLLENFNVFLPLNRKERFYTGSVLPAIVCFDNFKYIDRFLNLIPGYALKLNINPDVTNNNILFQTEYSFKESLVEKHFKEIFKGEFETKDTPDLVILITEPELILFVGEAKMFSSVTPGEINSQMKNQEWFIEALQKGINIKKENCFHFAILPQKLVPGKESLSYPVVFWEEIVSAYDKILTNDYFLNVLKVAIEKFDNLKANRSGNAISFGNNMDFKLSGDKIVELQNTGQSFWVGRAGGRFGEKFKIDIHTNNWHNFEYEINTTAKSAPNQNWFSSSEFCKTVGAAKINANSKSPAESAPANNNTNMELDDWHFAHLGRDYFLEISSKLGFNGKWDAPIDLVYIGKSGVAYIEKKRGRQVNPNWAVILNDGRKLKLKSGTGNMVENGLWDKSKCKVFSWKEIKDFFENQLLVHK